MMSENHGYRNSTGQGQLAVSQLQDGREVLTACGQGSGVGT